MHHVYTDNMNEHEYNNIYTIMKKKQTLEQYIKSLYRNIIYILLELDENKKYE